MCHKRNLLQAVSFVWIHFEFLFPFFDVINVYKQPLINKAVWYFTSFKNNCSWNQSDWLGLAKCHCAAPTLKKLLSLGVGWGLWDLFFFPQKKEPVSKWPHGVGVSLYTDLWVWIDKQKKSSFMRNYWGGGATALCPLWHHPWWQYVSSTLVLFPCYTLLHKHMSLITYMYHIFLALVQESHVFFSINSRKEINVIWYKVHVDFHTCQPWNLRNRDKWEEYL